jgi:hypothetical protein
LTNTSKEKVVFFRNPKTGETGTFVNIWKYDQGDQYLFTRLESGFKNKNVYSLPEGKTDPGDVSRIQDVVMALNYTNSIKIEASENNSIIVCGR